jgi:hypothetical protein
MKRIQDCFYRLFFGRDMLDMARNRNMKALLAKGAPNGGGTELQGQ